MEPQFKNSFANTPFRNSLLWDVFAINKFFDNSNIPKHRVRKIFHCVHFIQGCSLITRHRVNSPSRRK